MQTPMPATPFPATLASLALLVSTPAAQSRPHHDPYFTPTPAKSTAYMPEVIIRSILPDRAGNVWFATFGGPIRYDGEQFTNLGDEVGLPKTRTFALLEDRAGGIWVGSITSGASRYDGEAFTKLTVDAPPQPQSAARAADLGGLPSNDIHWVFEDKDGAIWLGTTRGVSRYDGEKLTNFTTTDGLLHDAVYAITQDPAGRMWFGTQAGVCSYDGKSFRDLAPSVGRSFQNVRTMTVDAAGHLWFGGQEGAFHYDGETLREFTAETGLLADFVGSMLVDRHGHVWFGHPGGFPDFRGGGATRYDGESFEQFTRENGLTLDTVYAMAEDLDGNIWFGSVGDGACRFDGKTFTDMSDPDRSNATKAANSGKRSR